MAEIRNQYKRKVLFPLLMLVVAVSGCIENDIPYPFINLRITTLKVEGQIGNAYFDNDARTVTINLEDTVNIRKVVIEELEYTEDAKSTLAEGDTVNLADPLTVNLSLYQEYDWTITAVQEFDRVFSVEDQVGASVIDVPSKRAMAFVTQDTDLSQIKVKELRLGPSNAVMQPGLETLTNFTTRNSVVVMYHDEMELWMLYVSHAETEVATLTPDVWVNVAWLKGEGREEVVHGFEYKEKEADLWSTVDPETVHSTGGEFTARLTGLKEGTTYVYRAVSDGEYGNEVEFTTAVAIQLSNGSFDNWHQSGSIWNPWASDEEPFWDTGNTGATTLPGAESNTVPTEDRWSGKSTGYAAQLNSKFVGFGTTVGKFAAGNIFVGEYVDTDGSNGVLDFGKPYDSYPTHLKGYFKYTSEPINYVTTDVIDLSHLRGEPDIGTIYIALGDWDSPVRIRTKASEFKVLDLDDPNIIAYGELNQQSTITEYQEFTIELEYRATNRKPKYLLIVCTASKYGDYFTGGTGSTLWVDELSLEFDY